MDTNKDNKTILDRLDIVELRLLQHDVEYAKQYLQEEGLDVCEEENYALHHMKKVRFMAKAISNKKQDQSLLETAHKRIKEAIQQNAQKTTETLIALLQSKTPSIQYRKLETWTDDEIREVLADIDLVQLMEELDKENK
jgi:hypothetical protein